MRNKLLERFFRYVKIDTQSADGQNDVPSTSIQFDLAHLLVEEMKQMGLKDVTVDSHCYVMGTLPANTTEKLPVIGFISHMDTAPDASGEGVEPILWEDYDGGDMVLPRGTTIRTAEFPELKSLVGRTLITASGDTLLGADDKAGIAEILTAIEYL
ncbi:MAG: peptidase T, partial [Flavobacteriales bacterium]|nr:peptidase T [Flavobacteriales bacterium]